MATYQTNNAVYTKTNIVRVALVIIISLLIGVAFALFTAKSDAPLIAEQIPTIEIPTEEHQPAPEKSLAFTVTNQPAGKWVIIPEISVSENIWLAIYENRDNQPGNILGAARFRPEHTAGKVELLRTMVPGSAYYAIVHIDDGDIEFDLEKDIAYEAGPGQRLMRRFTATE